MIRLNQNSIKFLAVFLTWLLYPTLVLCNNIDKPFPIIKTLNLDRTPVILPTVTKGKITLIALGFKRKSQYTIEKWLEPFSRRYAKNNKFEYFQVPMIGGFAATFLSKTILKGMRKNVPQQERSHYLVCFKNIKEVRRYLNLTKKEHTHLFLLDAEGIIRWQDSGKALPKKIHNLLAIANNLSLQEKTETVK